MAVVMMHFSISIYAPSVARFADTNTWNWIIGTLGAFRMPLLFAISGYLVAGRVRNGWVDRRNALRVASSYYLYVVWLGVYVLLSVAAPADAPFRIAHLSDFFRQLLIPESPLWFIFFLAVFVAVLTSLHEAPPAIVLSTLVVVSMVSQVPMENPTFAMAIRGTYYFLFFASGVYLRPVLGFFSEGQLWWKLPGVLAIFCWLNTILPSVPFRSVEWYASWLLRDVAGVGLGVAAVAVLVMLKPARVVLSAVGRRTLPIYVLHIPFIWLAVWAISLLPNATIDNAPMRAVAPLLVPSLIAAASIGVSIAVRRTPMRFLFDMPTPWRSRLLRASESKASLASGPTLDRAGSER
jgi:fucose 4-O-acetylase-like acetyltransferase